MSKTYEPSTSVFSSWMKWIKGSKSQYSANEPADHVHADEFSDHMLRDIGLLDGRNSDGYKRRRSVNGLLDDSFKSPR